MPKPQLAEVVYVFGTPGSNTVKIGRTVNLEKRFADIRTMSPVPLEILWTHPGGSELETNLHRHFAELRSHGEWFTFISDPVPTIRAAIEETPWMAAAESTRLTRAARIAIQTRRRAELKSEFQAALAEVHAIEDPPERAKAARAAVQRYMRASLPLT